MKRKKPDNLIGFMDWHLLRRRVLFTIQYTDVSCITGTKDYGLHGWCEWEGESKPRIYVSPNQTDDEIVSTFIHEVTHLCIAELNWWMRLGGEEEEIVCDQMAETIEAHRDFRKIDRDKILYKYKI